MADHKMSEYKMPEHKTPECKTPEYKAEIKVMLKRAILDPQGRAVAGTLRRLGTENVRDVRIGKHIEVTLSGERAAVEAQLAELIGQILSNPVMEEAHYTLAEVTPEELAPQETAPTAASE